MKKIRFMAFLAMLCVIGSVFAAGWTFSNDGTLSSAAATITGTVAEATSEDLTNLGTWGTPVNNLAIDYVNPNDDKSGYEVKANVTGSIVYTFQITNAANYNLVSMLQASAVLATYQFNAGNISVSASLNSAALQIVINPINGTVIVTVPAVALVIETTGAFTSYADYEAFVTAAQAQTLSITATIQNK